MLSRMLYEYLIRDTEGRLGYIAGWALVSTSQIVSIRFAADVG